LFFLDKLDGIGFAVLINKIGFDSWI